MVKLSAFSRSANGFLTRGGHAQGMKTPKTDGIVIAGGGLAAQRCAETLRRSGYEGPIRVLCAETHQPYDRPPLSKELLRGTCAHDELNFRDRDWYAEHDIELFLGTRASALSPADRRVELSTGESLHYERVLIATGSRPRTLPTLDGFSNVSVLRTVDDATGLRDVLARRAHLTIVGAGFIGQEVAATARRLGAEVTMIEAAPTPLYGILGEQLGRWFAELHAAEGVTVIGGTTIEAVEANGRVNALTLSDGSRIEPDHVVVGVGAQAEIEWLAGSGVSCNGGVHVDVHGRTDDPARIRRRRCRRDVQPPVAGARRRARIGRLRAARAPAPPRRCWDWTRAPRPSPASGLISTASGSNTSAMRGSPITSSSTAIPPPGTSPPPSPRPDDQLPRCSSIGRAPYPRHEPRSNKENSHDIHGPDR